MRRAAATFAFSRPTTSNAGRSYLGSRGLDIRPDTIQKLWCSPAPDSTRPGYTFSDLTQRLVPAAVLRAFPDQPVRDEDLLPLAAEITPTPVFTEDAKMPALPAPGPTGVRTAGDFYQWLVAWEGCVALLRERARYHNPVVAVGVELDAVRNLDDVVLLREVPRALTCRSSTPSTAPLRSTWPT